MLDVARDVPADGTVTQSPEVPSGILRRVRKVCLHLPETYEETAWVGIRWMIRRRNLAHVLLIDAGWPEAYARPRARAVRPAS